MYLALGSKGEEIEVDLEMKRSTHPDGEGNKTIVRSSCWSVLNRTLVEMVLLVELDSV